MFSYIKSRSPLNRMSALELIIYFATLIILPGTYAFIVIIISINKGILVAKYGYLCLAIFVVPLLITMFVTIGVSVYRINKTVSVKEL